MAAATTLNPRTSPGPHVIAVLDAGQQWSAVAYCAAQLATALHRPLVLFHAIEANSSGSAHPDPLDWDFRLQEGRGLLARIDRSLQPLDIEVHAELAIGESHTALLRLASHSGSIVVIGVDHESHGDRFTTSAVRQLIDAGAANVLAIPEGWDAKQLSQGDVLAAVDGSSHAECAAASAAMLARGLRRNLVLAHVIPEIGPTSFGPPETADLELRMQLNMRNETGADDFLERTRRRYSESGLAVQSLCLKGDVRTRIVDAIVQRHPSMVVISARGQGAQSCADLSLGGIATYVVSHLIVPTLIVQPKVVQTTSRPHPLHLQRSSFPVQTA